MIYIQSYNETHVLVDGNESTLRSLSDAFKFKVKGFAFMPAYKKGMWDGNIRLYNRTTKLIYKGLVNRVEDWAQKHDYKVTKDPSLKIEPTITAEQAAKFYDSLNLPAEYEKRDYQLEAFRGAINNQRDTIISPTGSGKSLIIYMIYRWLNIKTLLIVPTLNLIHQMSGDLKEYGYTDDVHLVYAGQEKDTDKQLTVSTWQSIFKMDRNWLNQFDCVIVDEVHGAKAKALTGIMEKMSDVKYRFGTTGTLDGTETNELVIEGLFGPKHQVKTTAELIEDKTLAKLNIKSLIIKWPEDLAKVTNGLDYPDEVNAIVTNKQRNHLIVKMVCAIPGNNLVMVNLIKKHGDPLVEMFQEATDRPVLYIKGAIKGDVRDEIRKSIEGYDDAIIVASTKAFATGSNVKKLNNIFFTSPSKSRITVLQSIGRVLRTTDTKMKATLYDFSDDISTLRKSGKSKYNFSMMHFFERIKMYRSEGHRFKVFYLNLPKGNT